MPSKKGKKPGNPGVSAGCTARAIPVGRAVFVPLLEGGGPESLGKSDLNFERRSRNDKSFERVAAPSEKTKNPRNRMIPGKILGAPGGTRTPDLLVRSQTLYPAELLAHRLFSHSPIIIDDTKILVNPFLKVC